MRDAWHSVLLVVAAARQPLQMTEYEQQLQQQDEEQQRHELHPCAAEAAIDSVAPHSGRTTPLP